jgi:hypothetical protein
MITLELRRPRASGLDLEMMLLSILTTLGSLACAWLWLGLPTPVCTFRAITGVPCLTCGGTRTLNSLLHGNYEAALAWNPLVFLAVVGAGLFMIYAALVICFRWPRIRIAFHSSREVQAARLLLAVTAAANWIYVIHRLSRGA